MTCFDAFGRASWVKKIGTATAFPTSCNSADPALQSGEELRAQVESYAPQGAIAQMKLGNTFRERWCYNDHLQPFELHFGNNTTNLCNGQPVTGDLLTLQWNYGAANNGNIQSQSITRPVGAWTQTYSYDSVNRLTGAGESGTGAWSESYGYDPFGNRWVTNPVIPSLETPVMQSWYGSSNRINTWGYDGSGNVTHVGSMSRDFTYDGENRQKTAVIGGQATTYSYDADGRRILKSAPDGTTVFVYDGKGQLAAEYSSEPQQGSGTTYLTSDHLGSTRLVTDVSGTPVRCYDYFPFGQELVTGLGGRTGCFGSGTLPEYPAIPDVVSPKYTSKERDAETGLDFFGARYMSSAQGRWTSPDAINLTDERVLNPSNTVNKYIYGGNNPLKYADPDGRDITLFGTDEGPAGHFWLTAYDTSSGASEILSFGPAKGASLLTRGMFTVPGDINYAYQGDTHMDSADDIRKHIHFHSFPPLKVA